MFVMAGKKRMLHDTLYDWCMGAWRLVFCNSILNKLQRQHSSIKFRVKALGALLVVSNNSKLLSLTLVKALLEFA
jgi:hypothetical protein